MGAELPENSEQEGNADETDAEDIDEFAESEDGMAEFDDELDVADTEEGETELDAVVELSSKEQSARALEIRRAIEARQEQRRLDEDLDYLDYDLDD